MPIELRTTILATLLATTVSVPPAAAEATVEVVHAFAGLPGTPTSRLLQASNGLFYGTLLQAGPLAAGAVFVAFVAPNAQLIIIPLHVFDGTDGRGPVAGLIEGSDGAFYGTTFGGGAAGLGTLFKITAQGQFTLLHSFSGADGASPFAGLVEAADGSLYGTTVKGGSADLGSIFKITASGSFSSVHSFMGTDGASPCGALVRAADGNFYGTAREGGLGGGTVFRLTPAGVLDVLHDFDILGDFVFHPTAGLIEGADGALYGTTNDSGSLDGSVFRITTAGVLTVLHRFVFDVAHGLPLSGVVQGTDGALYGTTVAHVSGRGAVFRLTTAGAFASLHVFAGPDGGEPFGGLVQARDGQLYGLTALGGAANSGAAFRVTTAGLFTLLGSFTGLDGDFPSGGVIRASDGNFYGTTARGGLANRGTVFRLSAGGVMTLLHTFIGPDGAAPVGGMVQARNGLLYGVTNQGGAHDRGTIFVMTTSGLFGTLHNFTEAEALFVRSPLIEARDGALYGLTEGIFPVQPGVAYRITPSGVFTVLTTVQDARGPLVEGADGNLYGTTAGLPFIGTIQGSVFRLTPAGVLTTVAQFLCDTPNGPCPNGTNPGALVAASDGALYGVTTRRDAANQATLFRVDQSGLAVVARFGEASPVSPLIQAADGRLYGMARLGADFSTDVVYSASTDGDVATVHVFSSAEGSMLNGRLLETEPGVFYGTAGEGGPATHGVVYRLSVAPGP